MNCPQEKSLPELSEDERHNFPKPLDIAQVAVYGLSILSLGVFLFLPFVNLLHPNPWKQWMGIVHGLTAVLAMILAVYTGHLAFPLLRGSSKILPQMRTLTFWSTLLSFIAIATGNFAYMRYSAGMDFGGTKAWLKENSPLGQYVFMEYHQFSVLFALPLGVVCTWILWQYGNSILDKNNRPILAATSVALMIIMFFIMGGFVTGFAVEKLHSV
jgi:hypothetical protein